MKSSPRAGSPAKNASTVYQRCIKNYQLEVSSLKRRVSDLHDRLRDSESPDRRLRKTCEALQQDKERLSEVVTTLQRKNLELSMSHDENQLISEKNEQLSRALDEANEREQKLIEKYKRASAKFRDLKENFEQMGEKYRRLIAEKQEGDQQRIELMNKQLTESDVKEKLNKDNAELRVEVGRLQNENQNLQAQLKKHSESVAKVMRHYQDAKAKKVKADERVDELRKMNEENMDRLKECTEVLKKRSAELEQLRKEKGELEHRSQMWRMELEGFKMQMSDLEERVGTNEDQERMAVLEEENMELQQELAMLKQKLNTQRMAHSGIREQLKESESLAAENDRLAQKLWETESEAEERQRAFRKLEATVGRLETEASGNLAEIERLSTENLAMTRELAKLQRQQQQDGDLDTSDSQVRKQLKDLGRTCDDMKERIEQSNRQIGDLTERNDELQTDNGKLLRENSALKEANKKLKGANNDLQRRLNTAMNEFAVAVEQQSEKEGKKTTALRTLASEIDQLKKHNDELTVMLENTQNQLESVKKSNQMLIQGEHPRRLVAQLQEKVEKLTQSNSELSQENDELRQEVQAVKSADYDAIVEELSDSRDQNRQLLQQLEDVHAENESHLRDESSSSEDGNVVGQLIDELNSSREENMELRQSVQSLQEENERLRSSLDKGHLPDINQSIEHAQSSLDELRDVVVEYSTMQKSKLRKEQVQLKDENEELKKRVEELEHAKQTLETEITEQKEKAADMINDREFAAMVDQLEALRARNAELEATVAKYRQGVGASELNAVLDELENVRSAAETLQKENEALKSEKAIDDLFSRREKRQGSSQERNVFISSDDEMISALPSKKEHHRQEEIDRLRRENKQLRRQLEKAETSSDEEITNILSKLSQTKEIELISQIESLNKEIEALKQQGNDEQYQRLLEQHMKVTAENEDLKGVCSRLQAQVIDLRKQLRRSDPKQSKEYQELVEKNKKLEQENADHLARIEALEIQLGGGENDPLLGEQKPAVRGEFQFDFDQEKWPWRDGNEEEDVVSLLENLPLFDSSEEDA